LGLLFGIAPSIAVEAWTSGQQKLMCSATTPFVLSLSKDTCETVVLAPFDFA
jgi:hypothetical protein